MPYPVAQGTSTRFWYGPASGGPIHVPAGYGHASHRRSQPQGHSPGRHSIVHKPPGYHGISAHMIHDRERYPMTIATRRDYDIQYGLAAIRSPHVRAEPADTSHGGRTGQRSSGRARTLRAGMMRHATCTILPKRRAWHLPAAWAVSLPQVYWVERMPVRTGSRLLPPRDHAGSSMGYSAFCYPASDEPSGKSRKPFPTFPVMF